LATNKSLRESIRNAIEAGLPTYAECGGLMYLAQSIHWHGESHDMVGVLPAQAVMHERPQGRGYVVLDENPDTHPWPSRPATVTPWQAHEFHYSALQGLPEDARFAQRVLRGKGIQQQQDGYIHRNLLASYSHLRNTSATPWVRRFLQFVQAHKINNTETIANAL
jgi:cobyrinic acid a,c-diamide synthase